MPNRKPAPLRAKTGAKQDNTENQQRKDRTKQNANLIPFVKNDPRINRNGRPKNFDQLRALVKDIASEKLQGVDLTRIEAMILSMSSSRNPNDKRLFLEYGFGKVTDELKIKSWQDEIIKALQERLITSLDVIKVLGLDDARPILIAAGATAIIDSSATETTSADTPADMDVSRQ